MFWSDKTTENLGHCENIHAICQLLNPPPPPADHSGNCSFHPGGMLPFIPKTWEQAFGADICLISVITLQINLNVHRGKFFSWAKKIHKDLIVSACALWSD